MPILIRTIPFPSFSPSSDLAPAGRHVYSNAESPQPKASTVLLRQTSCREQRSLFLRCRFLLGLFRFLVFSSSDLAPAGRHVYSNAESPQPKASTVLLRQTSCREQRSLFLRCRFLLGLFRFLVFSSSHLAPAGRHVYSARDTQIHLSPRGATCVARRSAPWILCKFGYF